MIVQAREIRVNQCKPCIVFALFLNTTLISKNLKILRPVYTGDFFRATQCNFFRTKVAKLRFHRDFSADFSVQNASVRLFHKQKLFACYSKSPCHKWRAINCNKIALKSHSWFTRAILKLQLQRDIKFALNCST